MKDLFVYFVGTSGMRSIANSLNTRLKGVTSFEDVSKSLKGKVLVLKLGIL
jgi:hypothetical protein